jgi:formylglycine-generating enzyme required for sulfatase activity/tRNA A-37 threonylcarbamoyl transferase component Bud32
MNPPILQLSDTDRDRLEQLLVDFDQHWGSHHLSVVAGQVQLESAAFKLAALTELAKIDLEYRQQQEPTRVEWYLERFPTLGESPATLSELLQAEIMVREAAGDKPTIEELQRRFSALDEQQVEALFANVAQQDEFSASQRARREDADQDTEREVSDSTKSIASSTQETLPMAMSRQSEFAEAADGSPNEFGRYRLLEELGRGAMGTVYLAEDTELRRRVALKRPRIAGTDEASLLERFYREAHAAATLDHPNICSVYDIGQHEGIPYITMAYVEGKPLSRVIRESRGLNPRAIAVLVRKIAVALAEAHAKGVIHRDLKPGNIMLNHRSDPIVMDFGLARQVEDVKERLTVDGTLIGTPGYMSPEQVEGDLQAVGSASDIYSLGVVLFEMLTGKLPFQGSVAAVIGKILRDHPPMPSSLRAGVPTQLEEICLKMMAKSPADRHATMTDVAEVLGAFIKASGEGEPAVSPPPIEPIRLADAMSLEGSRVLAAHHESRLRRRFGFGVLVGLASLGLITWAVVIYLKSDKATLAVNIDDELLRHGAITLSLDGDDHIITGPEFALRVSLGEHGFSVRQGNTVIRNPEQFTIERGQRKVLEITGLGISAVAAENTLPSEPIEGRTWHSCLPAMRFVWCPPGTFRMGSTDTPPPDANESPVDVRLTLGLWVGECEVTQSQWQAVMDTEPWKEFQDHRAAPNNAASHVTWTEANEFCCKLTESERMAGSIPSDWEFRLPTEAEWEFFCRAGTTSKYSFGDDATQLSEYAWWRDNADAKGEKYAHEVGQLKPNPWGLYDVHGNVYEWCQDVYAGSLPGGVDPLITAPDEGNRVSRGGGWDRRDELAHTSSNRRWAPADGRRNNVGLRVVISKSSRSDLARVGWAPPANEPDNSREAEPQGHLVPRREPGNEEIAAKTRAGWDLIFTAPEPVYGLKQIGSQVVTQARPTLNAPKESSVDRLSIRRLWFKAQDLFATGNTYDVRDCQAWMLSDEVAPVDLEAVPESSTDEQLAIRPLKPLPDGAYGVVLQAADADPLPKLLSTFVVNGLSKPSVENCQVILKGQGSATIEALLRNDGDGALNDTRLKMVLSRVSGEDRFFVRRMNLNGFDVAAHDAKQLQLGFDMSKEMAGEYQLSMSLAPLHEDGDSNRVAHADSNVFQIDNTK